MNRQKHVAIAGFFAMTCLGTFFAMANMEPGEDRVMAYQGLLQQNGVMVEDPRDLRFGLSTGAAPLSCLVTNIIGCGDWAEEHLAVAVSVGRFSVMLGEGDAGAALTDLVLGLPQLHLSVAVNDPTEGWVLLGGTQRITPAALASRAAAATNYTISNDLQVDNNANVNGRLTVDPSNTGNPEEAAFRVGQMTVDSEQGSGLVNIVAGAQAKEFVSGTPEEDYEYLGVRGASRLKLDQGAVEIYVGAVSGTQGQQVPFKRAMFVDNNQVIFGTDVNTAPVDVTVEGNINIKGGFIGQVNFDGDLSVGGQIFGDGIWEKVHDENLDYYQQQVLNVTGNIRQLDGDVDGMYQIFLYGKSFKNDSQGGGLHTICIRPNGDSSNANYGGNRLTWNYHIPYGGQGVGGTHSRGMSVADWNTCMSFASAHWSSNSTLMSRGTFLAASGHARQLQARDVHSPDAWPTWTMSTQHLNHWQNTTDNINNLQFHFNGMTAFTGRIVVYRMR
jgi:hypothetical protein